MRLRRRPCGILALIVLAGVLASSGCGEAEGVATYRVEPRPFLHQVSAEGVLEAAKATPVAVPSEVRRSVRIAWLAPDGAVVEQGDLVARFDSSEMEELLEDGRSELASSDWRLEQRRVQGEARLAEIDTDKEVAALELDHARRYQKTKSPAYSRMEIIESEIDEGLAEHRKEHAETLQKVQRELEGTERELLEIQRRRARERIEQAEAGLSALEVRAPHAGLLSIQRDFRGGVFRPGDQVFRGQTLAQIPDLSRMEAEVFVLEADAGALELGQKARVVVESHPEKAWPARIERVDSVAKPRLRGSPVQYFGITLALEEADPEVMKPGARVRAVLELERRDEALVVPRQAVFTEAGETHVWLVNGRGFEARPVKVGSASLGLMVIEEGLQAGDRVALEPPPETRRS